MVPASALPAEYASPSKKYRVHQLAASEPDGTDHTHLSLPLFGQEHEDPDDEHRSRDDGKEAENQEERRHAAARGLGGIDSTLKRLRDRKAGRPRNLREAGVEARTHGVRQGHPRLLGSDVGDRDEVDLPGEVFDPLCCSQVDEYAPEVPDSPGREGAPNVVLNHGLHDRGYGAETGSVEDERIARGRIELRRGKVVQKDFARRRARERLTAVRDEGSELTALIAVHPNEVQVRLRNARCTIVHLDGGHDLGSDSRNVAVPARGRRDLGVDGIRKRFVHAKRSNVRDDLVVVPRSQQRVVQVELVDRVADHKTPGDDGGRDEESQDEQDRARRGPAHVSHAHTERQSVTEGEHHRDDGNR